MAVRPDDTIQITFTARDDIGIGSAELVVYDAAAPEAAGKEPVPLATIPIPLAEQTGARSVERTVDLDLGSLGFKDGSELTYEVRVPRRPRRLAAGQDDNDETIGRAPGEAGGDGVSARCEISANRRSSQLLHSVAQRPTEQPERQSGGTAVADRRLRNAASDEPVVAQGRKFGRQPGRRRQSSRKPCRANQTDAKRSANTTRTRAGANRDERPPHAYLESARGRHAIESLRPNRKTPTAIRTPRRRRMPPRRPPTSNPRRPAARTTSRPATR